MEKAVGIIPARYGSTRFPGKPLADICGKPMVMRVYERARAAASLDQVVVATDDRRIHETVLAHGGQSIMTSPDHATGTDRLAEAAAALAADLVVNIQGDEPLLDPAMIDQLVTAMRDRPDVPMATLRRPIEAEEDLRNPNMVKVVADRQGFALYFSRSMIPYPRYRDFQQCFVHIGIYGFRRAFLLGYAQLPIGALEKCEALEQLRALENGFRLLVLDYQGAFQSLSVDVPEDLEAVRAAFQAQGF